MRPGSMQGLGSGLAGSLLLGGVIAGSIVAGPASASAATQAVLHVSTTGSGATCSESNPCGSIQTAVNTATSGHYAGADVTIVVAAGTYTESDTIRASSLHSLTITGMGTAMTTITANQSGSVFNVTDGTVRISGLSITNGMGATPGGDGGGVWNAGTLTIENSVLSNNGAAVGKFGGGIYNNGGTLNVTNSTLSGNSVSDYGGAIYNSGGTLNVTDSNLSDNSAGLDASGIYNSSGAVNVTYSILSNNSAGNAGGIFNNGGTMSVTDSTLSGNSAGYDGGGIYNYSGGATVTDSTLSDNSAVNDGGGIFDFFGAVNVTDSTLSGNRADLDGGGVFNYSTVNVTDSTLSGNRASSNGGGIFNDGAVNVGASIVANSTSGGNCTSFLGSTNDQGYNLTDDSTCGFTGGTDVTVATNALGLGTLGNNGGPTQTLSPLPGSRAVGVIPKGTTLNEDSVCPRTDQRGLGSLGSCTIGAVEVDVCATGLQADVLTARPSLTGTFTGVFCLNAKGVGTYTQGAVSGAGAITVVKGTTLIGALGKNLALAGSTNGTRSRFIERAPVPAIGTFTLTP